MQITPEEENKGEDKSWKRSPLAAWLPPFLVCTLVMGIYGVFMYANLVPQFQRLQFNHDDVTYYHSYDPHVHHGSLTEVVIVATVFHGLFLMFIISFLRALLTPPGGIPPIEKWANPAKFGISDEDEGHIRAIMSDFNINLEEESLFLKRVPVIERKKLQDYRFCQRCRMYKPDRTHHCSVCDRCVLRMDHHCPWIANCVGFSNYKYFLLLLFYAILCTGFILGSMLPRLIQVFNPILDVSYFVRYDLPVILAYFVSVIVFGALSVFFSFHLHLVVNAMSTIEYREKKNNRDQGVMHRWKVAHLKYDKGRWGNVLHVFGPVYTWLIPTQPQPLHRGTYTHVLEDEFDDNTA